MAEEMGGEHGRLVIDLPAVALVLRGVGLQGGGDRLTVLGQHEGAAQVGQMAVREARHDGGDDRRIADLRFLPVDADGCECRGEARERATVVRESLGVVAGLVVQQPHGDGKSHGRRE
ncbi:hypothetical protein OH807_01175 [Kitasatospora sp. NBC_01560]|uniref:hypothetical protein n=1 Tax=Kitasatospora sp. NBC_01560 TaxID=2975965 RepID=UPI003867A500